MDDGGRRDTTAPTDSGGYGLPEPGWRGLDQHRPPDVELVNR